MPPSRTRARAAHLGPERRRPQVLDAALAIALRDGVGAVTVGSVAAEMDVTRPVVYSCFPGRVEMVAALLDREVEKVTASILGALHATGGYDEPEQAFIAGMRLLVKAIASDGDSWRLLIAGEPDLAVSARFAAARIYFVEQCSLWIRPALEHWWQPDDLDHKMPVLCELFASYCESAIRMTLTGTPDWSNDELGEFLGRGACRLFQGA